MRRTLRRLARSAACTTALTALVGGLAVPLTATPAAAVGPVERVWTAVDSDGDGGFGLFYTDFPGGSAVKVEESPTTDVYNVSASADGSRIAYMRDTYRIDGLPLKSEVVVRDLSTRLVRVLESFPASGSRFGAVPSLSPDGRLAVWEVYDEAVGVEGELYVRKAVVGLPGSATTLRAGYSPYGFLSNSLVLMQDSAGEPFTLPITGGTPAAVANVPVEAVNVTMSPDGTKLAWGLYETSSAADLQVASLSVSGSTATVGAAVTIDATGNNRQPAFSRDGATVYWVKHAGAVGSTTSDLWSAPSDNSGTPAAVASTATADRDVAVTTLKSADTTPPAPAATVPFVLNGASAVVKWTLPSSADLSGVLISRAGRIGVYVPAPQTSFVDSGLAVGTTYTYTMQAVDRANNPSTAVTRKLTAIRPGAVSSNPTALGSTKASFTVRLAAGALSTTKYYALYQPFGSSSWTTWVNGATGVDKVFGSPAATNVAATTATPGGNYSFRVKVVDAYGNYSAHVQTGPAIVPFDQSKAILSGGSNVASTSAYLGSFRRLGSKAHYARITVTGRQIQVVGWRCTACGAFAIYDGATRIGTVDTYSSSTKARVVLFAKGYTTTATRTFTIRPLGTSGRPYVLLDGFGLRR